ncbi:MAG: hypothetical protein KGI75_07845 [Rhizobiaceae bacterium]|nr:hypothetical protein [Rhizobiaceae bacterium]
MPELFENELPSTTETPPNADEDRGRRLVLQLISVPSRCLFVNNNTLTGSGTFAVMRKLVDARCDELGLSDSERAAARAYSTRLLREALNSLFKQRQ